MFSRHITISVKINYKGHQPNSCYCEECIINRCSRHVSSRSNVNIHLLPEWDSVHVLLLQRMRIIYSGEQQPGVVPHSGKHLITYLILALPKRHLRTQTSVQALFISILSGISLYAITLFHCVHQTNGGERDVFWVPWITEHTSICEHSMVSGSSACFPICRIAETFLAAP